MRFTTLRVSVFFIFIFEAAALAVSKLPPLFILNQEKKFCSWETLNVADSEGVQVNQTSKCPKHILFQKDFQKAWYVEDQALIEAELASDGKSKRLAKVALDPSSIVDFYKDDSTGEIRILGLAVGVKSKTTAAGKRLVYEGREYKPMVLKWGEDAVAFVLSLRKNKWELIASAATRTGAEDTPGVKVVASQIRRSTDTISLTEILAAATCLKQKCAERFPVEWNAQGVAARLGAAYSDSAKVGFFPFGDSDDEALVAQVLIDRSTHLFGPPVRCTRKCQETHPLRLQKATGSKISVEVRGESALVSNENQGTGAVLVFQGRFKSERLFPENAVVFWTR